MKFGKNLSRVIQELSLPEWEPMWLNYKQLKKKIKMITKQQEAGHLPERRTTPDEMSHSADEVEFFRLMEAELKKGARDDAMDEAEALAYRQRLRTASARLSFQRAALANDVRSTARPASERPRARRFSAPRSRGIAGSAARLVPPTLAAREPLWMRCRPLTCSTRGGDHSTLGHAGGARSARPRCSFSGGPAPAAQRTLSAADAARLEKLRGLRRARCSACVRGAPAAALPGARERWAAFFLNVEQQFTLRMRAVEESLRYTKFLLDNKSLGLDSGFSDEFRAEMWTANMRACVSVYRELLLLEHWIVMSYCGFSKILKKHDRWTGYMTREKYMERVVAQQPFTQCSQLIAMLTTIDRLFRELIAMLTTIDRLFRELLRHAAALGAYAHALQEIGANIEDMAQLRSFEQHIAGVKTYASQASREYATHAEGLRCCCEGSAQEDDCTRRHSPLPGGPSRSGGGSGGGARGARSSGSSDSEMGDYAAASHAAPPGKGGSGGGGARSRGSAQGSSGGSGGSGAPSARRDAERRAAGSQQQQQQHVRPPQPPQQQQQRPQQRHADSGGGGSSSGTYAHMGGGQLGALAAAAREGQLGTLAAVAEEAFAAQSAAAATAAAAQPISDSTSPIATPPLRSAAPQAAPQATPVAFAPPSSKRPRHTPALNPGPRPHMHGSGGGGSGGGGSSGGGGGGSHTGGHSGPGRPYAAPPEAFPDPGSGPPPPAGGGRSSAQGKRGGRGRGGGGRQD
ncbi:hypothetical protein JKP88DRAFT_346652 [Tribonema minus]|uniref:SPX domain-containing protein n=1 Tax=Tribonema minus TaxID=303371 RepID=A0A835YXF1_9STRA|nr:hypothetical protein JKP88DRAFT_346652 [Tribonema minus]